MSTSGEIVNQEVKKFSFSDFNLNLVYANVGLNVVRDLLEQIKEKYPNLSYEFKSGRSDASDGSSCSHVRQLPDAEQGADHVRDVFYRYVLSNML